MSEPQTRLGKYLYSLRIQRGFSNVTKYLQEYPLAISNVYYRDIEAGRKTLGVDTANELCGGIKATRKEFYGHYLRDILPTSVADEVLKPLVDQTFSSLEERQALLERDRTIYRETFARALLEETHIMSAESVEMLLERSELMPILYVLYALKEVHPTQLQQVIDNNAISLSTTEAAQLFEEVGLATITGSLDDQSWRLQRIKSKARAPETDSGRELKLKFAQREVTKTMQQDRFTDEWTEGAIHDTGIREFSHSEVVRVRERILDLLAEAGVNSGVLGDEDASPYFLGLFFGSRHDYAPRILGGEKAP